MQIPDQFKTPSYNKLKSIIDTLTTRGKQIPQSVKDMMKSQIREELEPAFRRYITELLHKEFRTKKDRLSAIKTISEYQWIGKLYPSVFTDERTVFFLSMDKFIRKNTTLVERSYFFHERLIKEAVIFIDEFDATKDIVLRSIIDSGIRHRVNILNLFLNIHSHLM